MLHCSTLQQCIQTKKPRSRLEQICQHVHPINIIPFCLSSLGNWQHSNLVHGPATEHRCMRCVRHSNSSSFVYICQASNALHFQMAKQPKKPMIKYIYLQLQFPACQSHLASCFVLWCAEPSKWLSISNGLCVGRADRTNNKHYFLFSPNERCAAKRNRSKWAATDFRTAICGVIDPVNGERGESENVSFIIFVFSISLNLCTAYNLCAICVRRELCKLRPPFSVIVIQCIFIVVGKMQ